MSFGHAPATPEHLESGLQKIAPKLKGLITPERYSSLPKTVVEAMENPDTVEIFANPDFATSREEVYRFGEYGRDLKKPGDRLMVVIPQGEDKHLLTVNLGHRKREAHWGTADWQALKQNDPNGAYTEILVFDLNTNAWVPFKDPKGFDPIKFAEPRPSVENEHMGQWFGMQGNIRPAAFMLISRGKGDPSKSVVTEHYLDVITYPTVSNKTEILERIYTPGTKFADYSKPKSQQGLPEYKGGKDKYGYNNGKGDYPYAVPLREKRGYEPFPMTEKVNSETENLDEMGRLHIKLPAGMIFQSIEISAGCKWTDGTPAGAKGPIGLPGGHKLDGYLVSKGGKMDYFMQSHNAGPQGVLVAGPTRENYVTQEGDEVVLVCPKGTIYVMGYRLILEKLSGTPSKAVDEPMTTTQTQVTATLHQDPTKSKATLVAPPVDASPKKKPLNLLDKESAGGTQGARWLIDNATGERYLLKFYNGENDPKRKKDRCATECIANNIYTKMGIAAPESFIAHGGIVSKEIKGLQSFPNPKDYNKGVLAKQFYGNHPSLKAGFVVDAWLANWDVFGLDYDNVLKDPQTGICYRVDSGGALFFRGQGGDKPSFAQAEVKEIDTMRNPSTAHEAGVIYQGFITDADIKTQVGKLVTVMTDSVIDEIVDSSGISNASAVKDALKKRRNWLQKKYQA